MKVIAFSALMLTGSASADEFDAAYADLMDAAQRCQSTWFQSVREDSLDEIAAHMRRMTLANPPLTADFDWNLRMSKIARRKADECLCLTYPNGLGCKDGRPVN